MTSDPGIICLQHCTTKIFCFQLPLCCPSCNCQFVENDWRFLPFRLPYPFVQASQYPCSIVLRPANGDFLNDYTNSTDLHIAVTTSRGTIVEFDENGLQRLRAAEKTNQQGAWGQSLLVESVPEHWYDIWDTTLEKISNQSNWSTNEYHENKHNCYTFVLSFLKDIGFDQLSEAAFSKDLFCEKYIIPKTTAAGKYISLYRKIRDQKIYSHPIKDLKRVKSELVCNSKVFNTPKYSSGPGGTSEGRDNIWELRTIQE